MLYVIIGEDVENSLAQRLAARPAHLERLHALRDAGHLLVAGPNPAIDSNEGVRPRCQRFDQAIIHIIYLAIQGNFRQITANQGEIMLIVDAADTLNTFHCRLVTQMATNGITGIGWKHHHTAITDDSHCLTNQAYLRVFWVNLKILTHCTIIV
jgi:Uncharacterized protein conserved in bacteria